MDPMVSIIIPVYNGANYMREAIDSALAQTYSNIEIIVVNDGSTDQTRDIALSYGDKIRYFEKENGGVSTALNLGIKNMRGKYFSWLSHDDIYLPEKVQIQIDALRQAGDMSRVVYGGRAFLTMPERKIQEQHHHLTYRQSFLETGAIAALFHLIAGCNLLIPKFYFDVYGGFDENLRCIQDCKKWFDMFRGKRLIYIPEILYFTRQHPDQTGNTSPLMRIDDSWLNHWMIYNFHKDDLVGSGLTDLYHLYSAIFTRYIWTPYHDSPEYKFVVRKIADTPESPDANERAQTLSELVNDRRFITYLPKEDEYHLKIDFDLRAVTLGDNVKFLPFEQMMEIEPAENIRLLHRELLLQALIDTPVRKEILFREFPKIRRQEHGHF